MEGSEQQIAYFRNMLEHKPGSLKKHDRQAWNERADRWEKEIEEDGIRKARSERRVAATAAFLREHGLLQESDAVIDIGCGPGRFVTEFARTAGHATGTDVSDRMLEHGAAWAESQGVTNVDFRQCDFKTADIDALGWRGAFDLVYSCITPAVSTPETMEKAMAMSRAWCFNGNFLVNHSWLLDDVAENVFGEKYRPRCDGRASYALFNLLWLRGYSPYVSYYREEAMNDFVPDRMFAEEAAADLGIERDDTEKIERIYRYLNEKADREGKLLYPHECRYIWLLWDVRFRTDR